MLAKKIQEVIDSLNSIKQEVENGSSIIPGEDCYSKILDCVESLTDLLESSDQD
jgi:beta-galactosidase beta subunit